MSVLRRLVIALRSHRTEGLSWSGVVWYVVPVAWHRTLDRFETWRWLMWTSLVHRVSPRLANALARRQVRVTTERLPALLERRMKDAPDELIDLIIRASIIIEELDKDGPTPPSSL